MFFTLQIRKCRKVVFLKIVTKSMHHPHRAEDPGTNATLSMWRRFHV